MDGADPAVKVGAGGKGGNKGGQGGECGGDSAVRRAPLFVGMHSGCALDFLQNLEQAEERMEWSICLMP
jgi:hypothetical protein